MPSPPETQEIPLPLPEFGGQDSKKIPAGLAIIPLIAAIIAALAAGYWSQKQAISARELAANAQQAVSATTGSQFRGTLQARPDRNFNWRLAGRSGPSGLFLRVNDRPLLQINSQQLTMFPGAASQRFPLPDNGPRQRPLIVWDQLSGQVRTGPVIGGQESWRMQLSAAAAAEIIPQAPGTKITIFFSQQNYLPLRINVRWPLDRSEARGLGISAGQQTLLLRLDFVAWSKDQQ
jgi:hypothetical protein